MENMRAAATALLLCSIAQARAAEDKPYTDHPIEVSVSGSSNSRDGNFIFPDCLLCREERKEAFAKAKLAVVDEARLRCAGLRGRLLEPFEVAEGDCAKKNGFGYPIGFPTYWLSCQATFVGICRVPRLTLSGPAFERLSAPSPLSD